MKMKRAGTQLGPVGPGKNHLLKQIGCAQYGSRFSPARLGAYSQNPARQISIFAPWKNL
jgi:hypothetical protein